MIHTFKVYLLGTQLRLFPLKQWFKFSPGSSFIDSKNLHKSCRGNTLDSRYYYTVGMHAWIKIATNDYSVDHMANSQQLPIVSRTRLLFFFYLFQMYYPWHSIKCHPERKRRVKKSLSGPAVVYLKSKIINFTGIQYVLNDQVDQLSLAPYLQNVFCSVKLSNMACISENFIIVWSIAQSAF